MARELSEAQYADKLQRIFDKFGPRIERFMNRLVKAARDAGFDACDVYTSHDEEYTWGFAVRLFSKPGEDYHWGDLDFSLYILESVCRDGSREGFSFGLMSCYYGGRVCGIGYTPANYTDDLWITRLKHGRGSLVERWGGFEQLDEREFVKALHDAREYYAQTSAA